jgi:hypothetical protein
VFFIVRRVDNPRAVICRDRFIDPLYAYCLKDQCLFHSGVPAKPMRSAPR